ncbi:hypothetical protein JYB64_00200 [Algoriphagus aestuarii]|nr:hypothetical protein [Algoriphagus aestuarii]
MKKILSILIFGFLVSCTNPELPVSPEKMDENLLALHQALEGQLLTPIGKLKSENYYYGPETLQYRTDFYYDSQEREVLKFVINDGDTASVNLNRYLSNGKLDKTSVFSPSPTGLIYSYDFQHTYENDGRKIEVLRGIDGEFVLYSRFIYDDLGRLKSYQRGTDSAFDLHEYLYESESSDLIIGENYSQTGMTEPFYRYKYDYNVNGWLVSKSLQILGPDFRPAFQYAYNTEGQLIEEITNDLYFGTTPVERKTYQYYE